MSTATPPSASEFKQHLEVLFGPMIIGVFCELWLFGIIFAQVCVYRLRYPGDPVHLKLLVAIMSAGEFFKTVLNVKAVYSDFIFGQFKELFEPVPWYILVTPIVGQLPILASQIYLCFRVWVVSGRKLIPTAIGVTVTLLQLALDIAYVTRRVMARRLGLNPGSQVSRLMPPWAFSNATADVCLSLTLAYYLLQTRKQSISYRLNYILMRLASLAITTCLPPACISVTLALLEILETRRLVWIFFGQILGSTYTLCIIHARKSIERFDCEVPPLITKDQSTLPPKTTSLVNSREALAQKASLCASGRSSRMTPSTRRMPTTTLSVRFDDPEASIGRRSERKVEMEKAKEADMDAIGGARAITTKKRVSLVCPE